MRSTRVDEPDSVRMICARDLCVISNTVFALALVLPCVLTTSHLCPHLPGVRTRCSIGHNPLIRTFHEQPDTGNPGDG